MIPKTLLRRVRLAVAGGAIALPLAACAPEPPPPPAPWMAAGCYDSSDPTQPDIVFSGTENVLNNVSFVGVAGSPPTFSMDGTCTGDPLLTRTLVRAPTPPEALALCTSLDPTSVMVVGLAGLGYATPADAWGCIISI